MAEAWILTTISKINLVNSFFQRFNEETSSSIQKGQCQHEENLANETFDSLLNASTDKRDRTLSEIEFENEVNEFANEFRFLTNLNLTE